MKTIIMKLMMELPDEFGNTKEQEVMGLSLDVYLEDEESLKTGIKEANESLLKFITDRCPDDTATIVSDNMTFSKVHLEESGMDFMIRYQVKDKV